MNHSTPQQESQHSSAAVVPVSVLLSTYKGELAPRLAEALQSLYAQTMTPAQIVLVVDGPVDAAQERIVSAFADRRDGIEHTVVRRPSCGGLARALNRGLEHCRFDVIARMDSDDVAPPERLALQWAFMQQHPEIDVLAGWQAEFDGDNVQRIRSIKETPPDHDAICRALKWRNIISHPTIMIRKAQLSAVGGYSEEVGLLEDYDLHMRLMSAGARYAALQQPMVMVRVSQSQRVRRGGLRYVTYEWRFRYRCYRRGNLSLREFLLTSTVHTIFRLLPSAIKDWLYHLVRRSPR